MGSQSADDPQQGDPNSYRERAKQVERAAVESRPYGDGAKLNLEILLIGAVL